mgnify:CR=1 FL=1
MTTDNSSIITITDENFEEQVLQNDQVVLVDFWAPWCGPCLAIAPTLEELADEYKGKVTIAKMNVDENANVPVTYGVRSIPFLGCFKGGELQHSIIGNQPKAKLKEALDKCLG